MKKTLKLIAIIAAFAVAFTTIPIFDGGMDAYAASKKTTAKKVTVRVVDTNYTTATIKWNKVKSPNSGYAVFRDGKVINHFGKKTTSFTDKGLKSGTRHTYQICTYKVTKKKMYFNKKTKKWQSKKPKKKYRGGTKTVKKYSYKKKSNKVVASLPKRPAPTQPSQPSQPSQPAKPGDVTGLKATDATTNSIAISWNKTSGTFTGYEVYKNNDRYCSVGSGNNSVTIRNLSSGTKYTIKVRTYSGSSNTYGNFASISVTTKSDATTPTVDPNTTPEAVTGLKASSVTYNSANISWNKLSKNVTGYEVRVNDRYYREVGSNTNALTVNNLSSKTTYKLKVRAYYSPNATTNNYGTPAEITVTTEQEGTSGGDDPGDNPGTDNPGTDNPGTNTGSTFDYHNIPINPTEMEIGDGTYISKCINSQLLTLTNAWMAENLPSDATDAEKVNLCKKCICELNHTPEAIAIMGNPDEWDGNSECIRWAIYFDTCAKSAGLISATRSCQFDSNYGVGWYSYHRNNFVWVDGTGYIIDYHGNAAKSTLSLINYDWQNWHIITTNTKFNCRYY